MNESLSRKWLHRGHILSRSFVSFAALSLLASCTTKGGVGAGGDGTALFVGKILTMDDQGTIAEAVSVDGRGRILKVGTEKDVREGLGAGVEPVRLAPGQVLMPGFIDPHMHLLPTLMQSLPVMHNLAPCLPPPYAAANAEGCQNYVLPALKSMQPTAADKLGGAEFIVGMNLDPSRQALGSDGCSKDKIAPFMDRPMHYLEDCVSKDRPVLVVDQSGHLAYVNQKAFEVVCIEMTGKKECDVPHSVTENGGEWVKDRITQKYTGLLRESPAFEPFFQAMDKGLLLGLMHTNPVQFVKESEKDILQAIQALRAAGLTTVADGGLASKGQIDAVKFLAERPNFPLRITGLVRDNAASGDAKHPPILPSGPDCDPTQDPQCKLSKWLGVGGIKLWVDGSTQGCTAQLAPPYKYQDTGHCAQAAGEGRSDFTTDQIVTRLKALWNTGAWRFQLHANGNGANQTAIDAFTQLQMQKVNPHRLLFIHNTVGVETISEQLGSMRKGTRVVGGKMMPALDARVTHLIGHVAYWGNALEGMLGKDGAQNIDPVAFDRQYEVPFSFHSDSMVTPSRPLWFVEQAITRRTWTYPDFTKTPNPVPVLGARHAATVEEALRAITVEPARQHELDAWLGSIEPGKVADFVVLGANPLDYDPSKGGDPTKISQIPVVQTYLNGQPTVGSP
ncbi:amidohydrolase family protein [Stigmatella sp. ncwal1]|uniref:Amidohydrolase family protein n=1 Tax=Stigmatella ashevillensis TaxID=2995309 RepID=A0ABT5DN47_9BACT|nr:amidohydrolase family protein [Stigmatella ashevillena]MDC0713792.1 amidohydrolase family protein [Stigmatella ashevillena]